MYPTDLVNNLKATVGWAGATIATSTTTTSTVVIDRQGFESVAFLIHTGTYTDGTYVFKILETDNSDGTTGAVEVGTYQKQDTITTAGSNLVKKVGALMTKRYCTLSIVSTSVTTGCVFKSSIAVLGAARNAPVA